MGQDFVVGKALLPHHCCTDLAEAYAVAPSGSSEHETGWSPLSVNVLFVHYEG